MSGCSCPGRRMTAHVSSSASHARSGLAHRPARPASGDRSTPFDAVKQGAIVALRREESSMAEFPKRDLAAWQELAKKELKGATAETLARTRPEGLVGK